MRTKTRSVIKAFAYISLFVLVANMECPDSESSVEELSISGTYVHEDMESGIKETWSIEREENKLFITIKTEQLGPGEDLCDIQRFDATIDVPGPVENGDTASGTLNGTPVSIELGDGDVFVIFGDFVTGTKVLFDKTSDFVLGENLSCPGQGAGEFVGTWRLNVDMVAEEIWSIVQTPDNRLMITRRQIFVLDNFCGIDTFEAVVSDTDPRSATGEAFNLSLSLEINEAGELIAISGGGAPSTYNQTNPVAETLSCPTE